MIITGLFFYNFLQIPCLFVLLVFVIDIEIFNISRQVESRTTCSTTTFYSAQYNTCGHAFLVLTQLYFPFNVVSCLSRRNSNKLFVSYQKKKKNSNKLEFSFIPL